MTFDPVISELRKGFSGYEILAPLSAHFDDRGNVIKAKLIMGYDRDFKTVEKISLEGITKYLDSKLVLYSNDCFVPLRNYFDCEKLDDEGQVLYIKLFNKVRNGNKDFDYIAPCLKPS